MEEILNEAFVKTVWKDDKLSPADEAMLRQQVERLQDEHNRISKELVEATWELARWLHK